MHNIVFIAFGRLYKMQSGSCAPMNYDMLKTRQELHQVVNGKDNLI